MVYLFYISLAWCTYIDAKEGGCAGCWQCFTFPLPLGMFKCSNIGTLRTKLRANYKIHVILQSNSFYVLFKVNFNSLILGFNLRRFVIFDLLSLLCGDTIEARA